MPIPHVVLLMLIIASLPGLAAEDAQQARLAAAMTTAIQRVDRADGIDAAEAEVLASAYFLAAISGCGGIGTFATRMTPGSRIRASAEAPRRAPR